MTERERIIATFSPAERQIYERIGGRTPTELRTIERRHVGAVLKENAYDDVAAERIPVAFALARRARETPKPKPLPHVPPPQPAAAPPPSEPPRSPRTVAAPPELTIRGKRATKYVHGLPHLLCDACGEWCKEFRFAPVGKGRERARICAGCKRSRSLKLRGSNAA